MKSECKISKDGTKYWVNEHEKLHRENEPAVEYPSGTKCWYINGKYHREDGPAIEYANGEKYWYYHGEYIKVSFQKEFERWLKLKIFM